MVSRSRTITSSSGIALRYINPLEAAYIVPNDPKLFAYWRYTRRLTAASELVDASKEERWQLSTRRTILPGEAQPSSPRALQGISPDRE
jgi:hypothetical protein